jgi:serine/threonine protein kinase HipA of HipAB toxin-antitoxin module
MWGAGTGRRLGEVGATEQESQARRDGAAGARVLRAVNRVSYRNAAEANKPTASQVAAHNPSNRNNTAVIDTRSDQ